MSSIENIIVNNKTYKVQTLGVLDTLYLQAELVHALGPSIGNIVDILTKAKGNIGNIDAGEIGVALSKIEPETIKKLQTKILSQIIKLCN